jgi:hypothetical protein
MQEEYDQHAAGPHAGTETRPADEAQAADDAATEAEGRSHDGDRGG